MLLSLRLRAAVSALSICVLSACGGGGDDVSASAQNVLKPSSIAVLSGDGNINEGNYPVDTVFVGASGTGTLGGEKVEWLDISSPGSSVKGQLIISEGNSGRYAIMFVNEGNSSDKYACRGSVPWSADQLAYLTESTPLVDLPLCTGTAQINRGKFSQFLALNLTIQNVTSLGRFLSVTADLNWSVQPNEIDFVVPTGTADEAGTPAT